MDYDERSEPGRSEWGPDVSLAADAYEQLRVLQARRKLSAAEAQKYEKLRACLEAKKALVVEKTKLATVELAKAEAERDRARELRLSRRDRRRLLQLRKQVAEVKEQAAIQIRGLVKDLGNAYAEAQSEQEKRVYLEQAELLDPQDAEFLACPKCGKRMEYEGDGRSCPYCCYRPENV